MRKIIDNGQNILRIYRIYYEDYKGIYNLESIYNSMIVKYFSWITND